jgi:hypothetical protein
MATLTVWRFASWDAANQAIATLEVLAKQDVLKIHDAPLTGPGTGLAGDVRGVIAGPLPLSLRKGRARNQTVGGGSGRAGQLPMATA